jgi:hypothetical protein
MSIVLILVLNDVKLVNALGFFDRIVFDLINVVSSVFRTVSILGMSKSLFLRE